MTTRFQQLDTDKQKVQRRATSKGLSFGPLATAITVGTVAVLLGVTFIGDWLRTPKVSAEVSPTIISPNGDLAQDSTNFSYTLNEDAEVTINVFDAGNALVRTLKSNEFQTRGQHVTVWDGKDNVGQPVGDGRYRLDVTAKGTMRAGTQSATVLVDTAPPTLRLANLNEVNRVRDANLSVEGITDPDAVVQVRGDPATIPVSADGHFNFKRQLLEGSNKIEVLATDPAGNTASVSRELILVTQPPQVTVTSPANGVWTKDSMVMVAGTAPAGTSIKINGQAATVNADGRFEREVILQEGENVLKVAATDDVGNVTTQEVIARRKSTAPPLSVNVENGQSFQQADVQIIGKTEPGALVLVGGQTVAVSSLGEFQTNVKLLNGDNLLDVTAQDQAGNSTRLQRRIRYNVTAPEAELARVARNLPDLSTYFVPVLVSLPVLLILAYWLTRPVSLVVSADGGSFQPGLPEEGRFMRLSIDLSKAARTTVEIKDRRGNTVATLLHRRHRGGGLHTLHWDGYDDFGRVVAPGAYTVEASASTAGGSVKGTLNIEVQEDRAVHRQYLRNAPSSQDEETTLNRSGVRATRASGGSSRRR